MALNIAGRLATGFLFGLATAGVSAEANPTVVLDLPQGRVVFQLENLPPAQSLVAQLPQDLKWVDYGGNEKITYPKSKLTTAGAPRSHAGKQGELCYYAPWGNLAFFTTSGGGPEAPGLILLGKVISGAEFLKTPGEIAGRLSVEIR